MSLLHVVVGATGTGKSAFSLDLADAIASRGQTPEIVNADAMQLYRGMDIGTAKIPEGERRGHAHHLFDVFDVTEESTVARYQPMARTAIHDILKRGNVPILVGGSGLYISSVIYDFTFPARDHSVRERLEAELDRTGPAALFTRLHQRDPITAERVGPHNGRRIVRALEVLEVSGTSAPAVLPDKPRPWMPMRIVGIRRDRSRLVDALDNRVLAMWSQGLITEVEHLLAAGLANGPTASRAIGYAQAAAQIAGECTELEAIAQAQLLTRRYARRQVSWFKRYPDVHWVDADHPDEPASGIAHMLDN